MTQCKTLEVAKAGGEIMISIHWAADYPALFVHPDVRSLITGATLLLLFIALRFCVTLEAHAANGTLRSRVMAAHEVLHRQYTATTGKDATSLISCIILRNHRRFQLPSISPSGDGPLRTGMFGCLSGRVIPRTRYQELLRTVTSGKEKKMNYLLHRAILAQVSSRVLVLRYAASRLSCT
jgi:hypothetical protein